MEINLENHNGGVVFQHPINGLIEIYKFQDAPLEGYDTYLCSDFKKINLAKLSKDLILVANDPIASIDIAHNFIVGCDFFWDNPDYLYHGFATPDRGPLDKNISLTSFCVTHPWCFESEYMNENYFLLIPISTNELKFLQKYGISNLERHFFDNKINVFNLERESSI